MVVRTTSIGVVGKFPLISHLGRATKFEKITAISHRSMQKIAQRTVFGNSTMRTTLLLLFALTSQVEAGVNRATEKTNARIDALHASIEDFKFTLLHLGEADKPYYHLTLSVVATRKNENPFDQHFQISQDDAKRIVAHLADDDFLENASTAKDFTAPTEPAYVMRVSAGGTRLAQNLGWNLQMCRRLDGLGSVLQGEPAAGLALLIARISGHRAEFENKASLAESFPIKGDGVRIFSEGECAVINVESRRGIGRASIKRIAKSWPKKLLLRLHLQGMEGLKLTAGETTVSAWVSSGGDFKCYTALIQGGQEESLNETSPYWVETSSVGVSAKIPAANHYFELEVPQELLKSNPDALDIHWVDFYR
jgi:hypothetical protein